MRIQWIFALAVLPLASCSQETEEPARLDTAPTAETSDPAETAGNVNTRPSQLAQCTICHTFDEGGANQLGPNLWNIYNKPAASHADFAYSASLRNSGLVWDDASLDAYLADPRKTVPGGKMSFAGLKNPEKRQEVIEYLATLKPAQ